MLEALKKRLFGSWKTTLGGGVVGLFGAGIVKYLETKYKCDFSGGFDMIALVTYFVGQVFGALVTDGNKTV